MVVGRPAVAFPCQAFRNANPLSWKPLRRATIKKRFTENVVMVAAFFSLVGLRASCRNVRGELSTKRARST